MLPMQSQNALCAVESELPMSGLPKIRGNLLGFKKKTIFWGFYSGVPLFWETTMFSLVQVLVSLTR